VPTPWPVIDHDHVRAFWARGVAAGALDAGTTLPAAVEPFGDGPAMADELAALVAAGAKRATAGALADYEHAGEPLPEPGGLWIVVDGAGRARAVVRTTEVRIGPVSSVDDAFAWDEGEGDRTRDGWLAAHERYFRRHLPTIGEAFDPDLPTVFERFEVVYAE
jgi:uncharacterized protein YhfF